MRSPTGRSRLSAGRYVRFAAPAARRVACLNSLCVVQGLQGRTKIGVAITTVTKEPVTSLDDLPLITVFLPAFLLSLTEYDMQHYNYTIYIGFDAGDQFYDVDSNLEVLRTIFDRVTSAFPSVELQILRMRGSEGSPPRAWSQLLNFGRCTGQWWRLVPRTHCSQLLIVRVC